LAVCGACKNKIDLMDVDIRVDPQGRIFLTNCPNCGSSVTLKNDEVAELLGVSPNDVKEIKRDFKGETVIKKGKFVDPESEEKNEGKEEKEDMNPEENEIVEQPAVDIEHPKVTSLGEKSPGEFLRDFLKDNVKTMPDKLIEYYAQLCDGNERPFTPWELESILRQLDIVSAKNLKMIMALYTVDYNKYIKERSLEIPVPPVQAQSPQNYQTPFIPQPYQNVPPPQQGYQNIQNNPYPPVPPTMNPYALTQPYPYQPSRQDDMNNPLVMMLLQRIQDLERRLENRAATNEGLSRAEVKEMIMDAFDRLAQRLENIGRSNHESEYEKLARTLLENIITGRVVTKDDFSRLIENLEDVISKVASSQGKSLEELKLELERLKLLKDMELKEKEIEERAESRKMLREAIEKSVSTIGEAIGRGMMSMVGGQPQEEMREYRITDWKIDESNRLVEMSCPECGSKMIAPLEASMIQCTNCGLRLQIEGVMKSTEQVETPKTAGSTEQKTEVKPEKSVSEESSKQNAESNKEQCEECD